MAKRLWLRSHDNISRESWKDARVYILIIITRIYIQMEKKCEIQSQRKYRGGCVVPAFC